MRERIEVKIHGKWVSLADVPAHTCMGEIIESRELPNGHLRIMDADIGGLDFRPVEWRILED